MLLDALVRTGRGGKLFLALKRAARAWTNDGALAATSSTPPISTRSSSFACDACCLQRLSVEAKKLPSSSAATSSPAGPLRQRLSHLLPAANARRMRYMFDLLTLRPRLLNGSRVHDITCFHLMVEVPALDESVPSLV